MVFWNQLEGNNVNVSGLDLARQPKSPSYNMKMGFQAGMTHLLSMCIRDHEGICFKGAQHDIFLKKGTATPTNVPSSTPSKSSSFSIHETFTNEFMKLFFLTLVTVITLL